jgi:hypothetical protein
MEIKSSGFLIVTHSDDGILGPLGYLGLTLDFKIRPPVPHQPNNHDFTQEKLGDFWCKKCIHHFFETTFETGLETGRFRLL